MHGHPTGWTTEKNVKTGRNELQILQTHILLTVEHVESYEI